MQQMVSPHFSYLMKWLHWSMAIIILGLLILGFALSSIPAEYKGLSMMLHKSFGLVICVLLVVRVFVRLFSKTPKTEGAKWMKVASIFTILSLYVLMGLMAYSGYLMSCFAGYPLDFFHLIQIPSFVAQNKEIARILHTLHINLPIVFASIIGLHILAAFYHLLIIKDQTMQRMFNMNPSHKKNRKKD